MTSPYANRFWKKNWDNYVTDLKPEDYETTITDMIKPTFKDFPNAMALEYFGLEMTFAELDKYSNQFANMLRNNGFKKGDIVGINLPNTPQYVIAELGTLKSGCIVSGVSPLLSTIQIHYQLKDLGTDEKQVALVTLDSSFSDHIIKISDKVKQLKTVITTDVASMLSKIPEDLTQSYGEIPEANVTPLEGKKVLNFKKDILDSCSTTPLNVDITPDD
ncbi:hypothetical protein LCGC14_1460440, partial [marine sediment metagenome]